ncbi:MAG: hypothetical protein A3J47_01850 [Candidatus Yanofskybacteria bacterium RIFCSPHIGHO2_02_FULL_43_22]|uniref:Histidine kinase/HSP90-like ATPase domain-containing protein n=1 Tax=Candidatus Yanofskybacteria bacterium RIFCSPHIGHO2_02_FULL_43_22 TaxID=1802681 RepID=A0A1F8FMR0_9BACT|nr:MAG: hypothetical protein A3J47_01850 [Candidatus Yanofskybacteria bacterium RIFCSPHIGHO2_02_FULL_43_22]
MLGEERNQIAIDEVTVMAMKKLTDDIVDKADIETINSLAPIISEFQNRSLQPEEENNLVFYLQKRVETVIPPTINCLPNTAGFERIQLENTILIDPIAKQTNWGKIPGLETPKLTGSGWMVYVAPMTERADMPVVAYHNRIIMSRSIYQKFKDDSTLINLYLEAFAKGEGTRIRELSSSQPDEEEQAKAETEIKKYESFDNYVLQNWHSLGFPNLDTAESMLENMAIGEETAQNIHKYIINNFPEEISNYFVDLFLYEISGPWSGKLPVNFDRKNLEIIASMSTNPDFIKTLVALNINFHTREEAKRVPFPHISGSLVSVGDPDQKWYAVKYWDKINLIHESGRVVGELASNAQYAKVEQTKGCIGLYDNGLLRFFNAKTGEYYNIDFPSPYSAPKYEMFKFGERSLIAIGDKEWSNYPNAGGKPISVYDFETGEEFNPNPELGYIKSVKDEHIYYQKKDSMWEVGDVTSEGEIEDYFKKVREPEKIDYSRGMHKRLEGNNIQLVVDGHVLYERGVGKKSSFYSPNKWKDPDQYWRDVTEKQHTKVRELEEGGKKFILWEFSEDIGSTQYTDIDVRENHYDREQYGQYWKLKQETILFTAGGEEVLRLGPNERVYDVVKSEDKNFLKIVKYPRDYILEDGLGSSIKYWPAVDDFYYIGLDGQRAKEEDLAELPEFKFQMDKASYHDGRVSPIQGETWRVKFSVGRIKRGSVPSTYNVFSGPKGIKNEYNFVAATIIDRKTGQPILDGEFRNILYHPGDDLWECQAYAGNINNIDGKEHALWRSYYLDKLGNVVKTKEVGTRERLTEWYIEKDKHIRPEVPHLEQPLSFEKLSIMNRALEGYELEDQERMDVFINRCSQYAELNDQSFSIIAPILLRVEFLDPRLVQDSRILYLNSRLSDFNLENKVLFYEFLSQLLPDFKDGREVDEFAEKLLKVFRDKISILPKSDKESIYKTFGQLRNFGTEYLATGWNVVRYKTHVGSELIPEKIRPLVDFLRTDEKTSFGKTYEQTSFEGKTKVTLSQLIQTKRLNESRVQKFDGTADDLTEFVGEKTSGKSQEHIRREIIHPIYYQSVNNPYLFIRELVQNAHDAVIKDKTLKNKDVLIDIFSRLENDITLRIEDPVGMSLQEVLNYFLIPGETTKLGDKETIGYFGQGLFTLFRGAKEVTLKTSKGDGKVTKLRITPLKDDKGMTADLQLEVEQEVGDFRGTVIERTLETQFPEVEAAYIKNAVATYTSLVDANVVNVNLNESKINSPQQALSRVTIPDLGEMIIYDAPNNVIVQRGLYVKGMGKDFTTNLHDVEELLSKRGYVLRIPDKVSLTRSRNEIARKEEVMTQITEYLPLLKLNAYLEVFRQDIIKGHVIQLDNLPYDYFYMGYPTSGKIYEDAEKLRNGQPITNTETYLERGSLIKLLILLPVVEIDDKTWSLAELKEAALQGKPPLESNDKYEKLPTIIRDKLLEGKQRYASMESQREQAEQEGRRVPDFEFEEWQKQPAFVRDQIKERLKEYTRMHGLSGALHAMMVKSFGMDRDVQTTFYVEPGNILGGGIQLAHAAKGWGMMGWNLDYWKKWNMEPFKTGARDSSFSSFLETYSHEFGHIMERTDHFTHNQTFYRRQAEVLARIMAGLVESGSRIPDLLPKS